MKSRNFIKILILLSICTLGDFSSTVRIDHCCKHPTFMENHSWYKCPVYDVGDNIAARFCQMECIAKLIGISNGTNLNYEKINSLIASLRETAGPGASDLHEKAVQSCKKVTEYQMRKNIQYDEESKCSAEFSYFITCTTLQINDLCPENFKLHTQACKTLGEYGITARNNFRRILQSNLTSR